MRCRVVECVAVCCSVLSGGSTVSGNVICETWLIQMCDKTPSNV